MVCAHTLSDSTRTMTLQESITFLEPTTTIGGALCQSASDWNALKTALEVACKELGKSCTKAAQAQLTQVSSRISQVSHSLPVKVNP